MPDLSHPLVQWFLAQLENLAPEINRESILASTMDRALSSAMGMRESTNLRALLEAPVDADRRATILIPGILGSLLASTQGISAVMWVNPALLIQGYLNLLDLADDGKSDASPDVEIVPFGIEKMAYLPLIQTLARHTRLYEFPYDWRKSNVHSARLLHQAIERWSTAEPSRRYTIVCHSMGGVVARTYMALYPEQAERRLEQVIMIGVPLHGTAAAALAFHDQLHPYLLVSHLNEQNDLTRFCRSMPSAYQLLAPPAEAFRAQAPYPFDWNAYDASAWPVSGVRQSYLDQARELHLQLAASDPQVAMVNIAGCHRPTVVAARCGNSDASSMEPVYGNIGPDSGDEQVPLWSTQAAGVVTYYVEEAHTALVSNDRVLSDIVKLLQGESPALPTTLPPPLTQSQRRRVLPLPQQLSDIVERIESGTLTKMDVDRLFFWR